MLEKKKEQKKIDETNRAVKLLEVNKLKKPKKPKKI
tara:strand:- start:173 stop:280 length:108 start_codon:yes stop_codon:yes gene_type:complete